MGDQWLRRVLVAAGTTRSVRSDGGGHMQSSRWELACAKTVKLRLSLLESKRYSPTRPTRQLGLAGMRGRVFSLQST